MTTNLMPNQWNQQTSIAIEGKKNVSEIAARKTLTLNLIQLMTISEV